MSTDLVRHRLDLSYDGARFHGWAAQPGLRTVEGELSMWIGRILRIDPPTLTCAGRTDAGVHARGQVVHVDLAGRLASVDGGDADTELARRLPRALPHDLVLRRLALAPDGFDARFSAIWRRYVYRLWDAGVVPDPLRRGYTATYKWPVDVAAINQAAQVLLGLHDFRAFCRQRDGATTVRQLLEMNAVRLDDGTVEITVRADAFCHSMVRSLVGAVCAVAAGLQNEQWLADALVAPARVASITVMPARGLTLEEVRYPDTEELARRATEARQRRSLSQEPTR